MTQALIEWFFAVWTVTGLCVSVWNLAYAIWNRRDLLAKATDEGTRFLLIDDIRRELLRVTAHLLLCAPAVLALLTPDRLGAAPVRSLAQQVALWGLLLVPACLACNSVLDALARRRLQRFYRERR